MADVGDFKLAMFVFLPVGIKTLLTDAIMTRGCRPQNHFIFCKICNFAALKSAKMPPWIIAIHI